MDETFTMTPLTPSEQEQVAKALEAFLYQTDLHIIRYSELSNLLQTELAKVGLAITAHPFKTQFAYEHDPEMAWDDDLGWMHKDSLAEVNELRSALKAISDATASRRNKEKPEKPER